MNISFPCYWIEKDANGAWQWTYYAEDGKEVAKSRELYESEIACRKRLVEMQEGQQPIFTS
jgi:uncharacterized protein YegP (UPF0339 family)